MKYMLYLCLSCSLFFISQLVSPGNPRPVAFPCMSEQGCHQAGSCAPFIEHDCSLKHFRTLFKFVGEVGIGGVVLYTGHLTGDPPPSILSPWLTLVLIPFASPLKNFVTTANPAPCKSLD